MQASGTAASTVRVPRYHLLRLARARHHAPAERKVASSRFQVAGAAAPWR